MLSIQTLHSCINSTCRIRHQVIRIHLNASNLARGASWHSIQQHIRVPSSHQWGGSGKYSRQQHTGFWGKTLCSRQEGSPPLQGRAGRQEAGQHRCCAAAAPRASRHGRRGHEQPPQTAARARGGVRVGGGGGGGTMAPTAAAATAAAGTAAAAASATKAAASPASA